MDWLPIVKDFGFPAVVVFWLLWERGQLTKVIDRNTQAVNRLTVAFAKLTKDNDHELA